MSVFCVINFELTPSASQLKLFFPFNWSCQNKVFINIDSTHHHLKQGDKAGIYIYQGTDYRWWQRPSQKV